MTPRVKSFHYHSSAPAISKLSRTPGYHISGLRFGNKPGSIEIDGKPVRVVSWSPTFIETDRPSLYRAGEAVDVVVAAANGIRSEAFLVLPPGNPYYGYVRPQARVEIDLRLAA